MRLQYNEISCLLENVGLSYNEMTTQYYSLVDRYAGISQQKEAQQTAESIKADFCSNCPFVQDCEPKATTVKHNGNYYPVIERPVLEKTMCEAYPLNDDLHLDFGPVRDP